MYFMKTILKNLKEVMKKVIPECIKSIGKEIIFKKELDIYRKSLKKIGKNRVKSQNPRIAFILQFPETWNSMKSVYETAEKLGLNPLIVCIPKPNSNISLTYEVNKDGINEAYNFFEGKNVNAINGKLENGEWFDLKEYNPDYVFYTKPYRNHYPDIYQTREVCQYAKICYIPYGFPLNGGAIFYSVFNAKFLLQTYFIFAPSKNILKKLKRLYICQYLLKYNHFKCLGYPRFDLLLQDDFCKENTTRNLQNLTITWMPRWEFDISKKGQKCSHFLEYYDEFIKFVKNHQELNFIFRPHPLMWETLIDEKLKTEEEIKNIKKEMESIHNLKMDKEKDYLLTLKNTDILIADMTSLLIEYFVTGKPIILSDTPENYMKDGKIMLSSLYRVDTWKEVEKTLMMLINGNDYLYDKRKKCMKEIIPEKSTSGEDIVNCLMKDYNDKK